MNLISDFIKGHIRDQWLNHKISLTEPQARQKILSGARLYFYCKGMTQPRDVYQDERCNVIHCNPLIADCNGEFPDVFLEYMAEDEYTVKLETSDNVPLVACDTDKDFKI